MRNDEIKNEIDEIKKMGRQKKRKHLKHEADKYKYAFQQYETIRFFGESIYSGKISIRQRVSDILNKADKDQANLLSNITKFNDKSVINLDQKQKKVRIKSQILLIVQVLVLKVEN